MNAMTSEEILDKIRDIVNAPIDGDEQEQINALADIYYLLRKWHAGR